MNDSIICGRVSTPNPPSVHDVQTIMKACGIYPSGVHPPTKWDPGGKGIEQEGL